MRLPVPFAGAHFTEARPSGAAPATSERYLTAQERIAVAESVLIGQKSRRRAMGIPADRRAAGWCPRVMAAALAVVVTGPARVEGQLLHDSTRLVEVFGTPTRVLALGLENRQPGEPVVLLFRPG